MRKVSLDDLAKELGVSKTTVSRAISGTGRISQATRERVREAVAKTGYVPNAAAYNLSISRTKNLACSIPLSEHAIASSFFREYLFGVSRGAVKAGYDVIIVDDSMEELYRIAGSHKVDGLVLSLFNHGDAAMKRLVDYGVPVVLTGVSSVPGVIQMGYDSRGACRRLTSWLLDTWKTGIGLILTSRAYVANEGRAAGFRDAMTARGEMHPRIYWNDTYDSGRLLETAAELCRDGIRGVICGDDSVCTDLLAALSVRGSEEGIREIAGSLKLASFHSNRFLHLFHPEIPTVDMDPMILGEFAARLAVHEIEEGNTPASTMIEYELHLP